MEYPSIPLFLYIKPSILGLYISTKYTKLENQPDTILLQEGNMKVYF